MNKPSIESQLRKYGEIIAKRDNTAPSPGHAHEGSLWPRRRGGSLAVAAALLLFVAGATGLIVQRAGSPPESLAASESSSTSNPPADGSSPTSGVRGGSLLPPTPLLVGESECIAGGTAYEMTISPDRTPDTTTFLYYSMDPGAGVATLTFYQAGATFSDLTAPGLTRQVAAPDSQSLTVTWLDGSEPVALLSGKRLNTVEGTLLADAIEAGDVRRAGFTDLSEAPTEAQIFGHSCTTNIGFIAVEVVQGTLAGQAQYLLDTDPTSVEDRDGSLILMYNRADPAATVPTSPIALDQFRELVSVSESRHDRP